jgi:hypothetical protein
LRRTADELGRASRRRFSTTGGIAPASSTGYGAPATAWASKECERGASSSREEGERSSVVFIKGGRGEERSPGRERDGRGASRRH